MGSSSHHVHALFLQPACRLVLHPFICRSWAVNGWDSEPALTVLVALVPQTEPYYGVKNPYWCFLFSIPYLAIRFQSPGLPDAQVTLEGEQAVIE